MKKIILPAILLLFAACHRPYDAVFSTYSDGSPKLVFTVIDGKAGQMTRVGEKMYYEDGTLMYEKHYKDDRPTGQWKYYHSNGQLHAQGTFTASDSMGSRWQLFDNEGNEYEPTYDSMRVLQFTNDKRPLSVAYFIGGNEIRYQFNDNYTLNAKGSVVDGKKNGHWDFFYANGQKMLEANYSADIKNGAYNSYRENGIPFFRGFYINGQRANIWEFYDEQGNLAGTKDFDTH